MRWRSISGLGRAPGLGGADGLLQVPDLTMCGVATVARLAGNNSQGCPYATSREATGPQHPSPLSSADPLYPAGGMNDGTDYQRPRGRPP
jgi:hypothetical protein